jgi:hypothetical protein
MDKVYGSGFLILIIYLTVCTKTVHNISTVLYRVLLLYCTNYSTVLVQYGYPVHVVLQCYSTVLPGTVTDTI